MSEIRVRFCLISLSWICENPHKRQKSKQECQICRWVFLASYEKFFIRVFVVIRFQFSTSVMRSCFQSLRRVISRVSLSLIFIWWLSWVPVSTSITMSLSVNSYTWKNTSFNPMLISGPLLFHCRFCGNIFTSLIVKWAILSHLGIMFGVNTHYFEIILHVIRLVAFGHTFQECHCSLPHFLVIIILQFSTLCKCKTLSRKL